MNGTEPEQIVLKMVKLNQGREELLEQAYIIHRQQSIFLFKAFGKIGRAGETGIKCNLGNIMVFLSHQFFGFLKPELF